MRSTFRSAVMELLMHPHDSRAGPVGQFLEKNPFATLGIGVVILAVLFTAGIFGLHVAAEACGTFCRP
jgi:hypothetical protein